MSFISFEFILFFIAVFFTYFALPHRFRWMLLLGASYFFYAYWNINYLILIIFSTLVDYFVALWLQSIPLDNRRRRKAIFAISISANLGVLFFFKYFNFFNQSFADLLTSLGITYSPMVLEILLPVGISFYTFQSLAYTFDVYRGQLQAERHVGIFATYVAFFPQLVAGPIERAKNIIPQLHQHYTFDTYRTITGLRLILWGVFKKVVIADRVIVYVNEVYSYYDYYEGMPIILATLMLMFHVYCDFSAYSDIAIGTARILGFDLMLNFRQPFFAISDTDFWRRWHLSLITWFRDYVYIPLGGNRKGLSRTLINIVIVFVLSGLWHGARTTFIIWGLMHGIVISAEILINRAIDRNATLKKWIAPPVWLRWALTQILRFFGYILFWSVTMEQAGMLFSNILNFSLAQDIYEPFNQSALAPQTEFIIFIIGAIIVLLYDYVDRDNLAIEHFGRLSAPLRIVIYYLLATAIILSLLYTGATDPFIYFQF